jgi:hypothetical protein
MRGVIIEAALVLAFIFGTSSTEEARALVNTDPVVPAGRLTVDLYQWYTPVGLRVDLERVSADPARERVVGIVSQIQQADYEGDRTALNQLYDQLVPFVDEPEVASRVRYWRGFAKWRRAINGFGETPTPKDLSEDLTEAESEFDAALQRDPGFVDAKVGAASCLFNRLFLEGVFKNEKDPQRLREILAPASLLLKDAKTLAPDNPRLLWVVGPNQWNTPPERGGRPR